MKQAGKRAAEEINRGRDDVDEQTRLACLQMSPWRQVNGISVPLVGHGPNGQWERMEAQSTAWLHMGSSRSPNCCTRNAHRRQTCGALPLRSWCQDADASAIWAGSASITGMQSCPGLAAVPIAAVSALNSNVNRPWRRRRAGRVLRMIMK